VLLSTWKQMMSAWWWLVDGLVVLGSPSAGQAARVSPIERWPRIRRAARGLGDSSRARARELRDALAPDISRGRGVISFDGDGNQVMICTPELLATIQAARQEALAAMSPKPVEAVEVLSENTVS
jgi:hypothetical protein